jgi:predicted ATPase/DNA-binding SARP family transcriptional activator
VDLRTHPVRGVTIDCRVLGPLEVLADGRPVSLGGTQRRAVMAVLLNAAGDAVSEDALIEALWGEQVGAAARNNVQSHISRLRAALGASGVNGPAEFVRRTAGGYRVELEQAQLDSDWVRTALTRARAQRDDDARAAASLLDRALSLWRGRPFEEFTDLPGWGISGLPAAQAGLDELATTLREELYEIRLEIGEHAVVLPQLEHAAVKEPLRERLHRLLAVALYRSDRPTEALAALRSFRSRLADDSGLDPSPELNRLEQAILTQDPALRPRRAASLPGSSPQRIRASSRGALVGRDEEVSRLFDSLHRSRLVTVTGPGGVGKSRLAAEVVDRSADRPDQTFPSVEVLEPTGLPDGEAFVGALAQLLGVRPGPGTELVDAVVDYLRGRHLLLVFDNCEHLLAAVAEVVQRIVDAAPRVSVLATSRQRLGLRAEQLFPLEPLGLTPPDADTSSRTRPDLLSAAGELFVQRARQTRPDFMATGEARALVEELCRHLDGLPLAIELAAAQLGTLGLLDLHEHLDDRLDLLALSRHATLRDVVDRSYDLLGQRERLLFEQLSAFDGGFTLEAVRAVAGEADHESGTTLTLARLVDASLVTVTTDSSGRARYSLLETLRLYAAERLRARESHEEAARRHGLWVVDLAERAETGLEGPDEGRWIARLAAEFPNVRTAWHAAVARGDLSTAARINVALACYAQMHGQAEVWGWARRLVEDGGLAGHPLEVAVHGAAAQACYLQGNLGAAEDIIARGLAVASRNEGVPRAWWCVAAANVVALFRGDHDRAERLAVEALGEANQSPLWQTILAGDVVLARLYSGDVDGARTATAACSRLAASSGSPTALAWGRFIEGEVALVQDPGHAVDLLEEALAIARTVNSSFVEGVAMVSLLSAAIRAADHGRAIDAVPMVIGHWQGLGGMWVQQWTTLRILAELLGSLRLDEEAAVLLAAADTHN